MDGISLVKVSKTYTVDQEPVKVLADINLNIPAHKITVILGRSGCGKTTLLRLVAGLESFEQGNLIGDPLKRKAYVFQEDRLMPWLDVRRNIAFGLNKKEINTEKIADIIEMVGLKKFEKAYPSQLSGGMRQRVSLARAFAYNPDFFMMDEPFSALDFFTREQMQKELLKIHERTKCSILFVTHSIDEALMLGDKIVILDKGAIKSEYFIGEKNKQRNLLEDKFLVLKKQIIEDLKIQEV